MCTFYCDFFLILCINCTSAFLVLISVYFTVFNLICPVFDKLVLFVVTVFVGVFISFGFHYATFITLTLVRPPLTPSRHHTFTTDHWRVPGVGGGGVTHVHYRPPLTNWPLGWPITARLATHVRPPPIAARPTADNGPTSVSWNRKYIGNVTSTPSLLYHHTVSLWAL